MPRRNRPDRRRTARPTTEPEPPAPSFEALARELVRSGKCSRLILDRPFHITEGTT